MAALRAFNRQKACLRPAAGPAGGGLLRPDKFPFCRLCRLSDLHDPPEGDLCRKRGLDARFWIRRLAPPNLQMHGFCNLLARPVFMSMLIVGSATVQF